MHGTIIDIGLADTCGQWPDSFDICFGDGRFSADNGIMELSEGGKSDVPPISFWRPDSQLEKLRKGLVPNMSMLISAIFQHTCQSLDFRHIVYLQ